MKQRVEQSNRLVETAPDLQAILSHGKFPSSGAANSEIRRETTWVSMRDGIRLATEIYFPVHCPAPVIASRTPYGRAMFDESFVTLAQHGYVVVSQDCRGTGESEPDRWDYYVYEREDSFDFVEWITNQKWFNGFLGGCGASYLAQTQWCMALHPKMSTIVPEVGGLGVACHTARLYMFFNAYARSVGRGTEKVAISYQELERQMLPETLAGGYFNESLHRPFTQALTDLYPSLRSMTIADGRRWLWKQYTTIAPADRAEMLISAVGERPITTLTIERLNEVFGQNIGHDAHIFAYPSTAQLCRSLHAPVLMITGWYDWGLNDALASWKLLMDEAPESVRSHSRMIITPSAHNRPGYHEGKENHLELARNYRTPNIVDLLMRWYAAIRGGDVQSWPTVIYYLMGENQWYSASAWPPPEAKMLDLYLGPKGALTWHPPPEGPASESYIYDPEDPTPTVGGSIVSYVYDPGSVDLSNVQQRADVLTYTTDPVDRDVDVVGPLLLVLYASSNAVDTDFNARLSDVFPDGRAIQLQSGMLRARYRDGDAKLLEPGRIYRFEIDMWATANRFKAGHRLRLDISSADFPRFDRNTNRGGGSGDPVCAVQTVYYSPEARSRFLASVISH
jgi:predicted acyl esterase